MNHRPRCRFLVPALALSTTLGLFATLATAADIRTHAFGLVGLAPGQAMVLNVVNGGLIAPPDPDRTRRSDPPEGDLVAEIAFLNGDGSVFQSSIVRIPAHGSVSIPIAREQLSARTPRASLRAQVRFSNPPEPDRILSTLEVIDVASGRTSFVLTAPPEPERN